VGTGVDYYMVVQAEGMANATATIYIDASTLVFGMGELSRSVCKIYPNPSSRDVSFKLHKGSIQHIEIYDLGGRLVWSEVGMGSNQQTISIDNISKGVYMVRVLTQEGLIYHERIIRN
jgi:hypothetical protein